MKLWNTPFSRSMSPALVADYQTKLREKKLLEAKLHEFYELAHQKSRRDLDASELRKS